MSSVGGDSGNDATTSTKTPSTTSIRSSNASPYMINALKHSVFILQQGAEYRPDSSPHFTFAFFKSNIRSYRFVHSRWFRFLGFIICVIQLSLCFMEPSTLFLKSSNNQSILSLHHCLLIESYCILMNILALFLHFKGLGGHVRSYMWWYWYMSGICLLSLLVTVKYPLSFCRIYRFFRPCFPLIYWSTARVWKLIIYETFKKTLKVFSMCTYISNL